MSETCYLCERLQKKTIAVLRRLAQGHGLEVPRTITKKHLSWLVAGALLDEPTRTNGRRRGTRTIKRRWYVLAVQPGWETKVRQRIKRESKVRFLAKQVGRILLPRKGTLELRKGKRVVFRRKRFPGYLLIHCTTTADVFHLIRDVGFNHGLLPDPLRPEPVSDEQVEAYLKDHKPEAAAEKSKVETGLRAGDHVSVTGGLFDGYNGKVVSVSGEGTTNPTVRVAVPMLGRPVNVDVLFHQISKVSNNGEG